MKKYTTLSLYLLAAITAVSCNQKEIDPNKQLSKSQEADFKYSISRYINRLPNHVNHQTKFETKFDDVYRQQATKNSLDKYYVGENDTIYFEVSKLAPSLKHKKVATGGKLVKDKQSKIVYYEETYRTWKMDTTLLKERTALFFDKMINKKSLKPYYTAETNDDTHIEFPNAGTFFNKKSRNWELTNQIVALP